MRLPVEVLTSIFEVYTSEPQTSYSIQRRMVPLHVCRRWRSIAIDAHQLWTTIDPECAAFTNFALEHSNPLPLEILPVDFLRYNAECMKSYTAIIREVHRIRSAFFQIFPSPRRALPNAFSADLRSKAPLLQELYLNVKTSEQDISFFATLDMPILRDLEIEHVSVNMVKTLARPTLTSLKVTFTPNVSVHIVIGALDEMPLLEHLELTNLEPDNFPMPVDAFPTSLGRTLSLPNLKSVSLRGDPPNIEMARLLNSLIFPQTTKISYDVSSAYPKTYPEYYAAALPILIPKASASEQAVSSNSSLKLSPCCLHLSNDLLRALLWTSDSHSGCQRDDWTLKDAFSSVNGAPRLNFHIPSRLDDSMFWLFGFLDFSHLVYLDARIKMPARQWVHLLAGRPFPKLEKVVLYETADATEEFIAALGTPISGYHEPAVLVGSSMTPIQLLLPELKILKFHCTSTFRLRPYRCENVAWLPKIIAAFRRRVESGLVFDKIIIHSPMYQVPKHDIEVLGSLRVAQSLDILQGTEKEGHGRLLTLFDSNHPSSDVDYEDLPEFTEAEDEELEGEGSEDEEAENDLSDAGSDP
ncbi:hypothetical protein EIP86_001680 [Pleurotus ostreatoroseus]|nr:hypothetical protein EIP86_001680 [Pleurotus ostreatoroseus]